MLVREELSDCGIHYCYRNFGISDVELWLAEPPVCAVQDRIRIARQSVDPLEVVSSAGNRIARYRIPPFRSVSLTWVFRRITTSMREGSSDKVPHLSEDERRLYLESSPQVPRHSAIDTEAARLAGEESDVVEVARRFFLSLSNDYRYVYPVRRRGALHALAEHRGDCGQLSCLFVALCRARNIPARIIVGTRLTQWVDVGHAWAEVWADGIGWIPLDPSLGNALARLRKAGKATADPESVFGALGGTYFAFSIGFDIPLERYGPAVQPRTFASLFSPRVSFGGKLLRWGYETLDGRVPFLQPAYPRSYAGLGLRTFFRCHSLGHWALRMKRLRWTFAADVLEQSWAAFFLFFLVTGLLASFGGPWLAHSWVIAVLVLTLLPIGLRAWLRGAFLRLPG